MPHRKNDANAGGPGFDDASANEQEKLSRTVGWNPRRPSFGEYAALLL